MTGHSHPPDVAFDTACPECAGQRATMRGMKNDRPFSLRLPSEMLDRLDQIAEEDDRTIADVIRRAVRAYLLDRPS